MKLVKSLLLGSATALVAAAGAQAADLPFRKAAPVDYVRVCDIVSGGGYFYIPGTDTCIKLGGEVRFEYAFIDNKSSFNATPFASVNGGALGVFTPARQKNNSGFLARGKIEADVRTQTAYGLIRANVRLEGDRYSGSEISNIGTNSSSVSLDRGYITFAGITAGRVQSFFDFYADNYNYDGIANSDQSTTVLAYTATFGGGFSATVAAEDPNGARRNGITTIAYGNTAVGTQSQLVNGVQVGYAGTRYPDAVAQVRYDAAWGAVQLSGAYHDVNTITGTSVVGTNGYAARSEAGFAVQAGIDLKLPMLAAGDELWLQGAYQEGAYLYQDSGANLNSSFTASLIGGYQASNPDAVAVGIPGTSSYRLEQGKGFSVMGALHHYFTPQFHDVLYGSYEEIGYGNIVKNIDWTRGGIGDASEYRIGNQFIFTPVHNLDIGVDVMYAKINQDLGHEVGRAATALPGGFEKDPDTFEVRLRLNRDF